MFFDIRQIFERLERIIRHIENPAYETTHKLERMIMALDATVQTLIDEVATNNSLVASVIAGLKVESDQITALQAQIADLQSQIGNGAAIDAEDLAAITKAAADLKDTNTQLQTAVPASTPGV